MALRDSSSHLLGTGRSQDDLPKPARWRATRSATVTGLGSDTMNVSPRARELLNAVPMAELRFWIHSTDRRAVNIPNGNGIGRREILKRFEKFPFPPPQKTRPDAGLYRKRRPHERPFPQLVLIFHRDCSVSEVRPRSVHDPSLSRTGRQWTRRKRGACCRNGMRLRRAPQSPDD